MWNIIPCFSIFVKGYVSLMKLTQICDGCGEEFSTHHDTFCAECSIVRIAPIKSITILRQGNTRNLESKQRDKGKRRRESATI